MIEKRIIIKSDLPKEIHEKLILKVKKRHVKDFTRSLITMTIEGKIEIPEQLKKHIKS